MLMLFLFLMTEAFAMCLQVLQQCQVPVIPASIARLAQSCQQKKSALKAHTASSSQPLPLGAPMGHSPTRRDSPLPPSASPVCQASTAMAWV